MKKTMSFVIAVLSAAMGFLLVLSSCGGLPVESGDASSEESKPTEHSSEETTCETEPVAEAEKVLYGLTQTEADANFADILDGLFSGKTAEIKDDIEIGGEFLMHFPDMVYYNGEYMAYYISYATRSGNGGIGLAKSTDGVNFTDCGVVINPDRDYDTNGAYFAGVWYDSEADEFTIAYEAKGRAGSSYTDYPNIAYATSKDGVNWDKKGILLYRNKRINYQTENIGTPDLYKVDGVWYVFLHGYDSRTCQIGVAYGTDLTNLKVEKKPVIPTKTGTDWAGTTGRRDIIYVGGWYYMVYEVSTAKTDSEGYNGAYWTHMFARSKDLLTWETTEAPLLHQESAGFGYDGPCWCIIGEHIYVYFRVGGHTERAELVLAGG